MPRHISRKCRWVTHDMTEAFLSICHENASKQNR